MTDLSEKPTPGEIELDRARRVGWARYYESTREIEVDGAALCSVLGVLEILDEYVLSGPSQTDKDARDMIAKVRKCIESTHAAQAVDLDTRDVEREAMRQAWIAHLYGDVK